MDYEVIFFKGRHFGRWVCGWVVVDTETDCFLHQARTRAAAENWARANLA